MTKLLYITGLGRSGSTLLCQALGQHPAFTALGEVRQLWSRKFSPEQLCSCGQRFRECGFWNEVMDRLRASPETQALLESGERLYRQVARFRHLPMLVSGRFTAAYGTAVRDYSQLLGRLYQAVADVSDSEVIVDASKRVSEALILRRMPDCDVRFVHLIRDSRGVAFSWNKKVLRTDTGVDGRYMRPRSCLHSSRRWLFTNWLAEHTLCGTGNYLRVRYEDFIARPREILTQVAEFALGTPVNVSFIDHETLRLERVNHLCFGNPKRMLSGNVALHLDDAWKEQLSPGRKLLVSALTWPVLRHYGYRLRHPHSL